MNRRLIDKLVRLDIDRLHEVLAYDPETGVLSWLVRLSPRCRIGWPAGIRIKNLRLAPGAGTQPEQRWHEQATNLR